MADSRWLEITPSPFAHELEGLNRVRASLPNHAPYRAWSNFEFRDGQGKWHEVDLLVLGRRRLHLVELKYYSGTLKGDDHLWRRDGKRAQTSPLKLARRKAQRLASKLQDELLRFSKETGAAIPDVRDVVPFVQEAVYLHHPSMRCDLPLSARIDLFGLDDGDGLPGISERLLEAPTDKQAIGGNRDEILGALMKRIGVVQRRQREAGSWVIDEEPLADGDGWQDWPAFHRVATTDRGRIRFYVTTPGASAAEQQRVRRVAEHEYRVMSRLAHDGLLKPKDLVDDELGIGLVYPDDSRYQRLDLWLADKVAGVSLADQLSVVRQVAEAVGYAHGNRIVHRGLTPQAVWVRELADGTLKALVGEWQAAGSTGASGTSVSSGVTSLVDSGSAGRLDALVHPDPDRRRSEAFQAPEGVYNPDADRVRLDVFALGALAYFLLTGRAAAADRTALRDRLRNDEGLDLAADLPQVASSLRALVLNATHPKVSERTPDVRTFLEQLAAAERALDPTADDTLDPLEATPGAVIAGRFRLERRLGAGSTAVGLLVTDLSNDTVRVLKVANDAQAAHRLDDEAQVLNGLNDPRLVRLIEGPLDLGPRRALLLDSAGEQTLGEVLRARARLSLDLLERWGVDLLEALVALDRAGVDHRDIKPSNLGVREGRGDRQKHLVLFDFSLSRAGATALTAGTPPYLDPFLDSPGRGRFDSAAERYSAAVVLFEMATGNPPVYGDGLTDPGSVTDEATIDPALFDASVAADLTKLFTQALAREAAKRFDTAADLLTAWRSVFAPVPKTLADDAEARATEATPETLLAASGLSARALSALEPYHVNTVGDLVALDPVRLNRLAGVAEATRKEVKERARGWRDRLGSAVLGRTITTTTATGVPTPQQAAELLLAGLGSAKAEGRRGAARLILGLDGELDAFAKQADLAVALDVTPGRIAQQVGALQEAWAADGGSRQLIDRLAGHTREALHSLGDVATVDELTDAVLASLSPMTRHEDGPAPGRIAAGLLRLALDRLQALERAEAQDEPLTYRRRGGRIALVATNPALLDAAEALARTVDNLLAHARVAEEAVVPARRAATAATDAVTRALGPDLPEGLSDTRRLLRLATGLAERAALSGAGEVHDRDLDLTIALSLALRGVGGAQPVSPQEVRDRVRARFPALPSLPDRPRLDSLVDEAGLGLVYDEQARAYRSQTRAADTTGLVSRVHTYVAPATTAPEPIGHLGHRLAESRSGRSFLALGVESRYVDAAITRLTTDFGAQILDVTQTLIEAMRAAAAQVGLPWEKVRAADAAPEGSRDQQGLATLVTRALPAVDEAIETLAALYEPATAPTLLTEASPLARYGHLASLARWTDLTAPRRQAVWLLLPQLLGSTGAVVDGAPVPLAAPGQYLALDPAWLTAQPVPTP